MNFKLMIGIIGIALVACNIPLLSPIQLFSLIFRIPVYQDILAWYSLFLLAITAGLVLYFIGRKEFSNRLKDIKISVFKDIIEFRISFLLKVFGFILIVDSLVVVGFVVASTSYSWGPPPLETTRDWIVFSLLLAWGGLTFISGVLWLVDGVKMGEGEMLSLKKEIDLEFQTKYPKDLFAKYVEQYPHNPEGVLEWHIHKKMKEGKTREQVIEELDKI